MEESAGAVPGPVIPATLALERAIEVAIAYNPQVGAAQEDVVASEALVSQAASRLLPRLDANSRRVTPVDLPAFSFQSPESTWETDISFEQPLYTGGSLSQGVRAARSYRRGSEGAYERTRQQIAFAVRQAYYAVLSAEEGVVVAQEVVDSAQETLRVARLRYEAGVAPQFDVLAAEARLARQEQDLIAARAARDIAWARLGMVLGVQIPEGTELSTPRPVTVEESDLATVMEEALRERPDLFAVQAQVEVARAQLAVARAGKQPRISASVGYTLREQTTVEGELFGLPEGTDIVVSQNSGYISLSASWSLFNGGQVYSEIQEAKARVRQADKQVESLRQQIELEVKSAYVQVGSARGQVMAAQRELAQAQEAHRIARIRYQEGVGTSVEILDAEASLGGAKTRLNQAIYGLNLAVAELELAIGRDEVAHPSAAEVEAGD
jgi:TolC family type I secretion outer membrane protein